MQKDARHNANSSLAYRVFENNDESLCPPSRIPLDKWQEILEEEYNSHLVGSIREEIVQSAVDTIYEGYLRRAVYGFVTNRVHEDWMRTFQCMHSKYDKEVLPPNSQLDEPVSPTADDPRSSQKVLTVYGRLTKLLAGHRKSPNGCEAHCANASRGKIKRREITRAKLQ